MFWASFVAALALDMEPPDASRCIATQYPTLLSSAIVIVVSSMKNDLQHPTLELKNIKMSDTL